MGTDNFVAFGDCPKPKKSKTSKQEIVVSYWAHLPAVLLHDIFDLLSREDRKRASSVCKHWRQNAFHPKFWSAVTFKIEQSNLEKAKFYTSAFSRLVSEATIKLNSLSPQCMEEFISLLQVLSENNNLRHFIVEATHCRFEIPIKRIKESEENYVSSIVALLKPRLPYLSRFSIGCLEDLSHYIEDILKHLCPSKVTHLGLASVKDDPGKYNVLYFDPSLFSPFQKLKILSIDYDHLTDEFLSYLEGATDLERLVVHLHGIQKDHPGTSNYMWRKFYEKHPLCELRLTVIHAFSDIENLHDQVLKKDMRLTHLKIFFCENVNFHALENLTSYYNASLRSFMWIDSLSNNDASWIFAKPLYNETPDPIVLLSWLCKNLEEIVLYGYKYWEENLVAIGRLRGDNLKRLEIAEDDILYSKGTTVTDAILELPKRNEKPWSPVSRSELHPVICSPTAGDSDEYILPIVLADLH